MTDNAPLSPFRAITNVVSQPVAREMAAIHARQMFETSEARFETSVPALAALSAEIERAAIKRRCRDGRIFVGFQRLDRFVPSVAARYLQLAERNEVYVFGAASAAMLPTHPNLHYIILERSDPLCNEWFIVMDCDPLQLAFSALDLSGFDEVPDLTARNFTGVKVSDPTVAEMLATALHARVMP